ncbi:MAG: hypothetical protein EOO96_09430 [Pedobacter sp.]|nr:MAG: hypothetical protein EOO96_09430 [Pedobacter sp.]
MFTKTIIPKKKSITIDLPENFIGENVRLIAIIEKDEVEAVDNNSNRIQEIYSKYPTLDLSNFKFNRNDANDFE